MAFARHNNAHATRCCSRAIEASSATWDSPRSPSGRALHPAYLHSQPQDSEHTHTHTPPRPAGPHAPARPPIPTTTPLTQAWAFSAASTLALAASPPPPWGAGARQEGSCMQSVGSGDAPSSSTDAT